MKKKITCDMKASVTIWVDIPEYLIETFEKYDEFDSYNQSFNPDKDDCDEIYELLNDEIFDNINEINWESIEIIDEEDVNDED